MSKTSKPGDAGVTHEDGLLWEGLNNKTYGIRTSELVLLTAGTGVGKTSTHRQASITQHEGGPVAWMYENCEGEQTFEFNPNGDSARWLIENGYTETPLYAHPPATRPAALAEDRNAVLEALAGELDEEQASLKAEVAWQHVAYFDEGEFYWMSGIKPRNCELYTHPPTTRHTSAECAQLVKDREEFAALPADVRRHLLMQVRMIRS